MFFWRRYDNWTLREAVIVGALMAVSILARETDHKFSGETFDVLQIRPATNFGHDGFGIAYDHIGFMDIDVWRWNGRLVVFDHTVMGITGRNLEPGEAETLGLEVPWRYRLPEGLILLACLAELFLVARKPRTVRYALVAGGIMAAVAGVFALLGLTWECALPGVLAVHHLWVGIGPLLFGGEAHPTHSPPPDETSDEEARPARPLVDVPPRRETAPRISDDPFRSPPQAPPVVVQRAETARASVPIEHDADAEKPKLLT